MDAISVNLIELPVAMVLRGNGLFAAAATPAFRAWGVHDDGALVVVGSLSAVVHVIEDAVIFALGASFARGL